MRFLLILSLFFSGYTLCASDIISLWDQISNALRMQAPKQCGTNNRGTIKQSLFDSDKPLLIELVSDFPARTDKHSGKLVYDSDDGKVSIDIEIEKRGASRSDLCGFPPFKLYLPSKKVVKNSIFENNDRTLKVVTHCQSRFNLGNEPNQDIYREYLLYKILNALDIPSFKVRLAKFKYKNPSNELVANADGFFIEDIDDLGKRYSGEELSNQDNVTLVQACILSIIEAMLFNDDYVQPNHNIKSIRSGSTTAQIPYDFDQSALVKYPDFLLPKVSKNKNNIEANLRNIIEYIPDEAERNVVCEFLDSISKRKKEVLKAIKDSPVNKEDKILFSNYFKQYLNSARNVASTKNWYCPKVVGKPF